MNKLKQWWFKLGDKQIIFFILIGGAIFLIEIFVMSSIAESCFN